MEKTEKITKIVGWVCSGFFLVALGMMFLPLIQVKTSAGEVINFYGSTLLFGGAVEAALPSGVYSFSFGVDVYLLIATQTFLLAAVSCFLAKRSVFNRVFSLLLAAAGITLIALSPLWVSKTSSLPLRGIELSYGFVLSCAFASLSALAEIVLLVLALLGGKKKK